MSSLIELVNISKTYQRGDVLTPVLHEINIQVLEGELLAIVGTSGSGKSTLMNILGLLDKPSTGNYFLNEINTAKLTDNEIAHIRNKTIGFIFQAFFLLPKMTIAQNVALPLTYRDMTDHAIIMEVNAVLERIGIAHLAHRYPNELSGGQQQRVAIARALVGKPKVILADEPTGNLDSKVGQEIMELFLQLNQLDHNTIIIITHDPRIAAQCSRTIHVKDGNVVPEQDLSS